MLGAQARAAEYHAARNASARQASREAEAQNLPPKSAPVSLSAFTKNVQVNRNKGNKSWIPLVFDENDEEEEVCEEQQSTPTPTQRQILQADHAPPTSDSDGSKSSIKIRDHTPRHGVPTAPRAMRYEPQGPSEMALIPSQRQNFAFAKNNQVVYQTMAPSTTPNRHVPGVYMHPVGPWMYGSLLLGTPDYAVDVTPEGMLRYGTMMVPTDLTPTKQEQKLSMLSQIQPNPLYGYVEPYFQDVNPTFLMSNDFRFSPLRNDVQNPIGPSKSLQFLSDLQAGSEVAAAPKTAIFAPESLQDLTQHQSPSDLSINDGLLPVSKVQILRPDSDKTTKSARAEEPYDRASKMQRFVEEQQAKAKSGRTVLNHAGIRRSQEEDDSYDGSKSATTKAFTSTQQDWKLQNLLGGPSYDPCIPKQPGVLDNHDHEIYANILHDQDFAEKSAAEMAWREFFGVNDPNWLDLRPVNAQDRSKMRYVMEQVAFKTGPRSGVPLFPGMDTKYGPVDDWVRSDRSRCRSSASQDAMKWFHGDGRGLQDARQAVDDLANTQVSQEGELILNNEASDVRGGLIRGAGNMLANLTEYLTETKSRAQDYFNRSKPVPDFAIDRGGLGANFGSISYFEDEKTTVFNAPSRIARDPRFWPIMEESVPKMENGWSKQDRLGLRFK